MIVIRVTYFPPVMFQGSEEPSSTESQITIPVLAKSGVDVVSLEAHKLIRRLIGNSATFSDELEAWK